MDLRIACLPGDGVGGEVTASALRALAALGAQHGFGVRSSEHPIGWTAAVRVGTSLPDETVRACLEADAILLGAVGDPDAVGADPTHSPETALLTLRAELGCWANLRPLPVWEELVERSALRPERVRGTDLLVVRELGGGLYYGEPRGTESGRAWNTLSYDEAEVERIAALALELAAGRRRHVTSVDKANVLEVSRLWRQVVDRVARSHEEVVVEHMYVDRAAMELVLRPTRFDVIVTGNLFGDVLSDEAGALAGSLGVLGSASLGGQTDLYEPVHGSAPDLAGQGIANPIGALMSVVMMLRHTFRLEAPAGALEQSIRATLADGMVTSDLAGPGDRPVGTEAFTDGVVARLHAGVGT